MKRIIAPLAAVLLVVFMFIVASATSSEEIIFPEIATLIIAAWLIENSPTRLASSKEERKPWETMRTIHWLMLSFGVIFVLIIAFQSKWIYIISPPLIVTFIEFANPCGQVCQKPVHLLLLLLLAAISGILWVEVTHFLLHWPVWITAGCIVIWIFFLFRRMQFVFPPAAAISLLPTIIPREMLLLYPLQVAIGVIIFIVIGKIIIAINLKSTDIS